MSTEITIQQDQIDINVDTTTIVIESPQGGYPLPSSVYSVFGRVGNVIAQDGDYNLTQLGDVTISNPLTGQALVYNGTAWVNNTETYTGTVTSVNMSVPTGLTISGNPITTAGTLAVGLASGYSIPTIASQSTWDTAYSRSLTSASVTGTTTKTLTLNEQGGGTITATWSDYDTAPVTSVFGRTGAVVAQSGDYTTLLVPENTNLYFTNKRARYAISGDATSGVVYSNTTGIIALDDIPNTSLLNDSITINGYLTPLGGTVTLTTTDVAEGTNLYYTQARFNSAFAAKTTTDLTEGTNLYFTNARAQAAITGTSPISVTSGNVSISQANSTTNGYLSSSDWISFNAKQAALTLTTTGNNGSATLVGSTLNVPTYTLAGLGGISLTGLSATSPLLYDNTTGTFSIQVANVSQNGYLSSTDWTTFNGKQAALSGTGFVKISGTTISYDNSTYLTTIEGIAAGGELSGTYASPSLVNSAVTGKVLTGVNITGGTIQATDSILTGFGKLQNQINGLIGGSIYKGTWNASTNTPTLTSSVGTAGWYYIVNVAGSTNLNGITDWNVGDWAIFNGGVWQKVDNTDAVISVNGFTGAVSLTTSNISEGTNLYYTDARARGALSAGTGISYNSTTGVITNSAPDQTVSLTGAGTTSISGTYPNFTITSNDQYVGTVTSVGITSTSAALTISNTPITSSGNIGVNFAGTSGQYVAGDGSLATLPSLTGYVPYTGATQTVDLGAWDLNARGIKVNGTGGLGHVDMKHQSGTPTGSASSSTLYADVNGDIAWLNDHSYTMTLVASANTANRNYTLPDASGTIALTSNISYPVTSVFGRTGAVTAQSGDYTTTQVTEGTNLYYTDARARGAISLTTTGNNGASTYNSTTGVLNVPTYTLAGLGGINLTSLSATSPLLYNNTTGVFSIQQASGSQAGYLSSADWTTFNSKQGALTFSSPLVNTAGTITINQATTSTNGYLSSTDWNTFNNKQSAITLTTTGTSGAATFSAGTLNIPQYQAALTNPVTGTGTTNYHAKFTGTSTLGNSLIYDDGTNVGIGTTSPAQKLQVNSTTGDGCYVSSFLTTTGAADTGPILAFGFNDGTNNRDGVYIKGLKENSTSGNYASYLSFFTRPAGSGLTEKMRITSTGNVGIGTSSPASVLEVAGTPVVGDALTGIIQTLTNNSTAYNASPQSGVAFQYKYNTGGSLVTGGGIAGLKENATSGDYATALGFYTRANGGNITERMRITSGGIIFINRTGSWTTFGDSGGASISSDANGSAYYAVYDGGESLGLSRRGSDGTIALFRRATVTVGTISVTGSATSYNQSGSDLNLKKNIEDWNENAFELFKDLKPKLFHFNSQEDSEEKVKGYIAQDNIDKFPEAYPKNDEGFYMYNPSGMMVYVMKALQEAYSKIEQLEAKVSALENKS